tara:strand:+ start:5133 stop:5246 length:114 start_codon:yes stop_codon:yes gene_type:complete
MAVDPGLQDGHVRETVNGDSERVVGQEYEVGGVPDGQ